MGTDIAAVGIRVDSTQVVTASRDLAGLEGKAKTVEQELDALAKKSKDSGRQVQTATQAMEAGFSKLQGIVATLATSYALLKTAQYIQEATLLAARYETLGVVMRVVGNNAGYTGAQMEVFAKGLEKTGISMSEARQSLTRMVQAQLDLNQSSKLARVAQDAAVIGNINSSEAFQRLVYGIQSGQVEMLRTIGINVNFEASYQKVAAATGRVVSSFTEAEKSQIRMTAAMDAGARIAGTYEAAMDTAGKQLMSLPRHLENLKVLFGLAFTPALAEIIETITGALVGLNGELSGDGKEKIADWGNAFRLTLISIEAEIMRLGMFIDKIGGTLTSAQMLLYGPGKAMGAESSTKRFDAAAQANIELEKRYSATSKALEDLAVKYIKLEAAMTPAGKAQIKAAQDALEKTRMAAAAPKEGPIIDLKAQKKAADELAKAVEKNLDDLYKSWGIYYDDTDRLAKDAREADKKYNDERIEAEKKVSAAYDDQQGKNYLSFIQWRDKMLAEVEKGAEKEIAIKKRLMEDSQHMMEREQDYADPTGAIAREEQKKLALLAAAYAEQYDHSLKAEEEYQEKRKLIIGNANDQIMKMNMQQVDAAFSSMEHGFREIQNMYEKGSAEYEKYGAEAEKMVVLQKAVAVANAVAAIANQGLGDPYTAFARIAMMVVTMTSLLGSIGASIGGGGGGSSAAPSKASTGLGMDPGESSGSVDKSWTLLQDTYEMEDTKLTGIWNSMKDLNQNIKGLTTGVVRKYGNFPGMETVEDLNQLSPFLSDIAESGSLFADQVFAAFDNWVLGHTTISTPSSGLSVTKGGSETRSYTDVLKETSWSLLGGPGHDERSTIFGDLDADLSKLLFSIVTGFKDALKGAAEVLGGDAAAVEQYFKDIGDFTIDLKGLTGKEIGPAIMAAFDELGDNAASALFKSFVDTYAKIDEGPLETVIRLAIDKTAILGILDKTGQAFSGTAMEAVALSEELIKIAGGLDKLTEAASTYYDKFFTAEEKQTRLGATLTTSLGAQGTALPGSRADYRTLVESLDLTNPAMQTLYVLLMQNAGAADEYYSVLEEGLPVVRTLKEIASQKKDLDEQLLTLGMTQAQLDEKWILSLDAENQATGRLIIKKQKALDIDAERATLQDQLNALTDTSAQALARQRDALDESNRALFDQIQTVKAAQAAAEEAAAKALAISNEAMDLQERLYAATDTTAEAAARARGKIDPLNLALFDTVIAAEAATAAAIKATEIARSRQDLEIQIMEASGDAAGVLAARRRIELAAAYALDYGLGTLTQTLFDTQDAAAAAAAATAAQEEADRIAQEAAQAAGEAYKNMLNASRDFFSALVDQGRIIKDFLDSLGSTTIEQSLATARRIYMEDLTGARAGDADAYGRITSSAGAYIGAGEKYNTLEQQRRLVGRMKAEMGSLEPYAKLDENLAALKRIEDQLKNISGYSSSTAAAVKSLDTLGIKAIFDLESVIKFVANAEGIPADLRKIITDTTKDYTVWLKAQLDSDISEPLRKVLIDGSGIYVSTVEAIAGELDPIARKLAVDALGTYTAFVDSVMGNDSLNADTKRLALTAGNNYLNTVTQVLNSNLSPADKAIALGVSSDIQRTVKQTIDSNLSAQDKDIALATSSTLQRTVALIAGSSTMTESDRAIALAITGGINKTVSLITGSTTMTAADKSIALLATEAVSKTINAIAGSKLTGDSLTVALQTTQTIQKTVDAIAGSKLTGDDLAVALTSTTTATKTIDAMLKAGVLDSDAGKLALNTYNDLISNVRAAAVTGDVAAIKLATETANAFGATVSAQFSLDPTTTGLKPLLGAAGTEIPTYITAKFYWDVVNDPYAYHIWQTYLYMTAVSESTGNTAINTSNTAINTANIWTRLGDILDTLKSIASYDGVPGYALGGIASGPESGYGATLHGTELIVSPRTSYPATVKGGDNSAEQTAVLKRIQTSIEAGNLVNAKNGSKIAKILSRFDDDGMPAERVI